MKKKNVIILCADEMRGDCAGFMGNTDIKTPNMDYFAEQSVVFEKHMTSFPKCVPARCSLVTGQYCHTYGWRTVSQTLEKGHLNLLDRFVEEGYETAYFGKNHCWHPYDLDNTFDYRSERQPFKEYFDKENDVISKEYLVPNTVKQPEIVDGWHYLGCETRHRKDEIFTDQTIDYIKKIRNKEKPFFLQLNIESPHPVYGVEEPYYSMYDRDKIERWPYQLPENAPLALRAQREVRTGLDEEDSSAAEIQCVYYGMITKVDYLLGKVLEAVKEEGLMENSIIMLWSDHGDYAGQYTLVEKWDTDFRECLLHVPFVIYDPDLPKGIRIDSLTETTDIAPTICELAGLEKLPEMHGESLIPYIKEGKRKKAVFADGGHEIEMRKRYVEKNNPSTLKGTNSYKSLTYCLHPDAMARAKMIRTDKYKMVVRQTGDNELYDLVSDPWEMVNRWDDQELNEVKSDLMLQLMNWSLDTDTQRPYLDSFTV